MAKSEAGVGTTQRIKTVDITVINKLTKSTIKNASAQLKIEWQEDTQLLKLVVACEEGIFSLQYTKSDLIARKLKADLDNEVWRQTLEFLFDADVFHEIKLPQENSNVVLQGKLYSMDAYDESGQLLKDELCEEIPSFELYVQTKGFLSVALGMIPLDYRDPDSCSADEADMLSWLLIATKQIELLRNELFKARLTSETFEKISAIKESEMAELTSDYKLIIRDFQDRFFQILQSKKQRIRELEGDSGVNLQDLNHGYVERSKLNLNRVNIDDIEIGDESKEYGKKRIRKVTKRAYRRKDTMHESEAAPVVRKKKFIKKEILKAEDRMGVKTEDSMGVADYPDDNINEEPMFIKSEDKEQLKNGGPSQEDTDYDSEDGDHSGELDVSVSYSSPEKLKDRKLKQIKHPPEASSPVQLEDDAESSSTEYSDS